ncbi:leucyl/phenylalanyl-tRNA--protein transferase [Polycladidibacter hongkongensis]|uniref:leucyl/phenylalanyl-tRNA--protein transferase n=1 Tax=Polycladidibacter hongkongensis TaxID=1647556 RepID=UPI00082F9BBD|nr:leucyl/phenylalanyl-tRNA--protein transferase [Pseudovibrio hongkongensis]
MANDSDTPVEITPQLLLQAYACGVFPMAESAGSTELFWLQPQMRGVLPLDRLHIPRRLARTIRGDHFEVRASTDFSSVINACAAPRADATDTWINPQIKQLYTALFESGCAHTIEVYQQGNLVGGLYGVALGGAFFGESMFSRARDASKVALVHLVARLRYGGYVLLDTQFQTDHLAQFGTTEIPSADYEIQLERALPLEADFFALPQASTGADVLRYATDR